ncbi:hypothetical protein THARTR1_05726 [Trichoderma harzianum]|uniref:Uncharacterized protein n=1 Tax=Trichoderma harzianum TaxID=5544 RepID=A0A2K0U818_TRIHA|nr:hypothetical protein THARTR1_05726 [Trichoderma harzianum]
MASKSKEKEPMPPPPLALSLEDLNLKPNDVRLQQAISCIHIYQAQATRLTREQQEEMCDIIKNHDYVIVPTAKTASAHKLYKETMRALKNRGKRVENLSWPIYLILSAIYKKLPKKYIKLVRKLYGSNFIGDYTDTYRTLLRGTDSASSVSANAPNVSQNPFAFSSSTEPFALSKDAPTGSTPVAAPAGSTLFSSSKNAPTGSTPFAASAGSSFAPAGLTLFSSSKNAPTGSTPVAAPAGSTLFSSSKNAPPAWAPFAASAGSSFAPAGSTLFSSSKNAPPAWAPVAAPADSTLFSSSKNAPTAWTNLSFSSTNPFSSSTNSFDKSDPLKARVQKTVAEAKAHMAQKAIEDQGISGPASQDNKNDLTDEGEDSDSSSSEVEVDWHKKHQASPINRENDPSFAVKRRRHQSASEGCNCFAKLQEEIAALRTENAARDKNFHEFVEMFRVYKTESRVFMALASGATYTPSESDAPEVWQKLLHNENNSS